MNISFDHRPAKGKPAGRPSVLSRKNDSTGRCPNDYLLGAVVGGVVEPVASDLIL
jgi:hypothetical protein